MRRAFPVMVFGVGGLCALSVSACESTQDTSHRIETDQSTAIVKQEGLAVGKANPDVKVGRTAVMTDANGSAIAVQLKNTGSKPLFDVPIAFTIKDAKGKVVFRNDEPGIEHSLTHVAVLPPGKDVEWVNDQVTPDGVAKKVVVTPGTAKSPGKLPKTVTSTPTFQQDPDGITSIGTVANNSDILQKNVVIYAVAEKDGKVVAAGRGQIPKVKPHKRARFRTFYIGNPKGAKISVFAPPTTLK